LLDLNSPAYAHNAPETTRLCTLKPLTIFSLRSRFSEAEGWRGSPGVCRTQLQEGQIGGYLLFGEPN
jgi:hypothetical protein